MAKKKAKAKSLRITLVRSPIGAPKRQRKTLEALGLRRLRQTVVKPDSAAMRGMIEQVGHLVKVEE
jgi:large subunit ribosomal protein L30